MELSDERDVRLVCGRGLVWVDGPGQSPGDLPLDQHLRVASLREGASHLVAVVCQAVGVRADSLGSGSQAEGEGAFDMVRVVAGVVEVLLVVGRFDVNVGVEGATVKGDVDVQECGCRFRVSPGEAYGAKHVECL